MAKQRNYSTEFKRQVVLEHLAGETLYGLSKRHDCKFLSQGNTCKINCFAHISRVQGDLRRFRSGAWRSVSGTCAPCRGGNCPTKFARAGNHAPVSDPPGTDEGVIRARAPHRPPDGLTAPLDLPPAIEQKAREV